MVSRSPETRESRSRRPPRRLPTLRTTLVCLRPMTLRPHEDAMHRNAMQRDATQRPGASGRAARRANGARGDPGVPSVTEPEQASRSRASPRATCKLVPTAKMLSLARDTPARTCILRAGRLYPKARPPASRLVSRARRCARIWPRNLIGR